MSLLVGAGGMRGRGAAGGARRRGRGTAGGARRRGKGVGGQRGSGARRNPL